MTLPHITNYDHGISAIDAEYYRPRLAAIHLIVEGSIVALVDTGTSFSVPGVIEILRQRDIALENVAYVFLTHVHLDHAGGAGKFLHYLPNAKLVVHPRGARHMVDPTKLIESAMAIYGREEFDRLYGKIYPVEQGRIIEASEGFNIELGGRPLLLIDTPGHARHHYCIFDEKSRSFFTGDTFGVSYREFDVDGMEFVFPTTTPVQFDPLAAHKSLDRIMSYDPQYTYLTHYSRIGNLTHHANVLHGLIDDHVAIARKYREHGLNRYTLLVDELRELLLQKIILHGCKLSQEKINDLLSIDIGLNARGLESWLQAKIGK